LQLINFINYSKIIFAYAGSPADNGTLEVSDEILEVNGRTLENATHTEVIQYIHEVITLIYLCHYIFSIFRIALYFVIK